MRYHEIVEGTVNAAFDTTGMNADQLKLLRYFQQTGQSSISSKELKKQPWGNTPYLAGLVRAKNGGAITLDDLRQHKQETVSPNVRDLMAQAKLTMQNYNKKAQVLFDKPNRLAIFSVPGRVFAEWSEDGKTKLAATSARHPSAGYVEETHLKEFFFVPHPDFDPKNHYTLGWVRFTLFGKDIWIDEVQSDLGKLADPGQGGLFKDMPEAILLEFLRRARGRGYQKFYMPTPEMKRAGYIAKPPVSVYTDLPKKMRFHLTTVSGLDPKVDGQQAWLLESRVTASANQRK